VQIEKFAKRKIHGSRANFSILSAYVVSQVSMPSQVHTTLHRALGIGNASGFSEMLATAQQQSKSQHQTGANAPVPDSPLSTLIPDVPSLFANA
jgi:hypothetical protein